MEVEIIRRLKDSYHTHFLPSSFVRLTSIFPYSIKKSYSGDPRNAFFCSHLRYKLDNRLLSWVTHEELVDVSDDVHTDVAEQDIAGC